MASDKVFDLGVMSVDTSGNISCDGGIYATNGGSGVQFITGATAIDLAATSVVITGSTSFAVTLADGIYDSQTINIAFGTNTASSVTINTASGTLDASGGTGSDFLSDSSSFCYGVITWSASESVWVLVGGNGFIVD